MYYMSIHKELKTKFVIVRVGKTLYDALAAMSEKTGVPVSEAVRRWLAHWAETGELPRPKGKAK